MPLQKAVRLATRSARQANARSDEEREDNPYAAIPSRMISHAIGLWRPPRSFVQHLSLLGAQTGRGVPRLALRQADGGGRAPGLFPLRVRSPRPSQATTHSLPSPAAEPAQTQLQTSARSQKSAEPWPSVAHEKAALSDTFAW